MDDEAIIALLQATYDSSQALVQQHEAVQRRTEEQLAVLRTERDLLLRRVATLEAAHDELQRTRAQLGDALRRAVRAEQRAEIARGRVIARVGKAVVRRLRAATGDRVDTVPMLPSVGGGLLPARGTGLLLVDIVGWPGATLPTLLERLAARRDADGTVMVLLTDSERFDVIRAHGFVFEYLSAGGPNRAERIAELSAAYRVDGVLVAEDDDDLAARDTIAGKTGAADTATDETMSAVETVRDGMAEKVPA